MIAQTEEALAAQIRDAGGPLHIIGGGTRPIGQAAGDPLHITGLTGITLYDPGALTLVARAGTPVAEITAALAAENQRLAFEPMDHRPLLGTDGTPTIGGIVAANVSGPRRIAVGACRDHMLGLRFVDGTGQIVSNGGRVMKNVTGYDLVKLLTGSYGTLGVLTEVSLKVLPQPETSATLVLHGLTAAQAVAAMSAALGSPYEVTGAAHRDATYLRIEGFADSVAYRLDRLSALLAHYGDSTTIAGSEALWTDIANVAEFDGAAGDIWRISVKPGDAPAILAAMPATHHQLDWGGGLIWAVLPQGHDPRPGLAGIKGHATLIRGTGAATFQPEPAPLAAISAGLRAKFDPRGILNPGIMS